MTKAILGFSLLLASTFAQANTHAYRGDVCEAMAISYALDVNKATLGPIVGEDDVTVRVKNVDGRKTKTPYYRIEIRSEPRKQTGVYDVDMLRGPNDSCSLESILLVEVRQ